MRDLTEGEHDDCEEEQETECEARDCEQAVRVDSFGKHRIPWFARWAAAAAGYERNRLVQVPRGSEVGQGCDWRRDLRWRLIYAAQCAQRDPRAGHKLLQ